MSAQPQTSKAPFRITKLLISPNPRYVPGSNHPRKRNYDIETRTHTFFKTIEEARLYRQECGGCIEALSSTGKSYQTYVGTK
ncbi:hypothetical protein [Pseudarthrobacter sp. PS3-L1]|uniref:hypothetical protein n=1 Tax=Pseudarthrobacter sp. PS3-L1 TaxID=3046207 RepID=UPI0024B88607|nr:hypothetical protein [Pseudarthrobacter sp. PS3-L1]MDJ0322135.1 hypothetical protein [Pseudarthrobacter sp. PS3-L1]